jgi:hypothetical protein
MKKYLLCGLIIASAQLLAQEEFEVKKDVEGVSSKVYEEDRNIIKNNGDLNRENLDLKNIEVDTEIKFEQEKFDIDGISYDFDKSYEFLDKKQEELDNFVVGNKNNNFYFGFGAYDKIDGLNYGLYYGDIYNGVNYSVELERIVKGEERENTDSSLDKINVNLSDNKVKGTFAFRRLDEEYGGRENYAGTVASERKLSEVEGAIEYKVVDRTEEKYRINFEYYYSDSQSASLSNSFYTRDWENNTANFYIEYDKIMKNDSMSHMLGSTIGYLYDEMYNGKSATLYLEGKDRFKINSIENTDFKISAALESSDRDTVDSEFNISAGIEATRKINDKLTVFAGFEKSSRNKSAKEIRNNFEYCTDIVAFSDVPTEDNYIAKGGLFYSMDAVFLEASASIIRSKDKIYYEQVDSDDGVERSIRVRTYDDELTWAEIGLKATYKNDNNFRSEASLEYNTEDKLPYNPDFKGSISGIYNIEKYELKATLDYNGDMYAKVNKNEKLDAYATIDIVNSYEFTPSIKGELAFENIFDTKKEVMDKYTVDSRKVTLRFNVKY